MKGTVKSFSTFYNYGFVIGEDNREYFVHWTFILMSGFKSLEPGQTVFFDPYETYRGWQARNVRPIEDRRPEERFLKPNPFTPQSPITDPAKFAGRRDSLINAVDALFNHRNVFVSGARGVGKTSLAIQLVYLTQGDTYLLNKLNLNLGEKTFNYLVADHRCIPRQSVEDIVVGLMSSTQSKLMAIEQRQGRRLHHSIDMDLYRAQATRPNEKTLSTELVNRFVADIEASWISLADAGYDGFCMFIDEVDCLEEGIPTAFFLKSVSEKLHADGYLNACFVVAGHEEYISALYKQHKSSLRMFENVIIRPMSETECLEIIDKALAGTSVSISSESASHIASLSAGYPTPIHQLGYHSFRVDRDNRIQTDDVNQALAHIIGELRYEEFSLEHRRIGPGSEEELITFLAKCPEEDVEVNYMLANMRSSERAIARALGSLQEKGFLQRSGRRKFKFREPLFRLYIRWKEGVL